MANVLDLKRRIRSVKNTRQITRAMKMVSAAKLRRAQEQLFNARPYAQMITAVLESLKRRIDVIDPATGSVVHPLLNARPEKNILLLVVSGDKGFAGAFNVNILKAGFRFLSEHAEANVDLDLIGRKSRDAFRRRYPSAVYEEKQLEPEEQGDSGEHLHSVKMVRKERTGRVEVTGDHQGLFNKLEFSSVLELARSICDRFSHEEIDACYLVYNEFKSVLLQQVVTERLLPVLEVGEQKAADHNGMSLDEKRAVVRAAASAGVSLTAADTREADEEAKKFGTAEVDYIYEQPPAELLAGLLPQYVAEMIYHALVESIAAEHAARMTATDAASNNASEIIDSLTLSMNRVRQAAITKEIIEIVSGASALE